MKNFDNWNIDKQKINNINKNIWCQPRDIWWISLGENIGFEQDGKGENYLRPVIVLKSFGIFTALIIPLTTSQKENKYHIDLDILLGQKSFAIITQIRLIDTKRLVEKKGKLDKALFLELKKSILDLLK